MTAEENHKQCKRCVLDTTAKHITFDSDGVCHYCRDYDKVAADTVLRDRAERYADFDKQIADIKAAGEGKEFDCILGLSGGVDSSYLALIAHQQGLRPLVVHFDNGWNNELAVKNIENIVTKLNFDLHTHVINWKEFRDLQLSYFRASVLDIEVPTDQLIFATLFRTAKEKGIKYILSGNNIRTEYVLPEDWCNRNKLDYINLKNIHDKYGNVALNNFPKLRLKDRHAYRNKYGIELMAFFNNIDFEVEEVKAQIKKELDWNEYSGKHYESIFTRFYQGYILPNKFNVDKRKAHLSSLICSKQITKTEALEELSHAPYPEALQQEDKEYVLKKWELTEAEFDEIMAQPVVSHDVFGYEEESSSLKFRKKLGLVYLYKFAYPLGLKKRPTA